jgi:hypothetical protein
MLRRELHLASTRLLRRTSFLFHLPSSTSWSSSSPHLRRSSSPLPLTFFSFPQHPSRHLLQPLRQPLRQYQHRLRFPPPRPEEQDKEDRFRLFLPRFYYRERGERDVHRLFGVEGGFEHVWEEVEQGA